MDLDITWAGAFIAGILSFASPCVLPLVPPYLAFLAGISLSELTDDGAAPGTGRRIVLTALVFVLGFSTVFVALGASASYIGGFVTQHLTVLGYIAGAVIMILGLHFLGVFRIGLLFREARIHVDRKPVGLFGAYVIGLAFAFGWTPCVGPVLAAILLFAGSEADVIKGAGLLFAYSMGIGLPFLLAAFFANPFMAFMGRFRRHLGLVEKIMGGLLVITGLLFLTNSMATLSYLLLEWFPTLGTIG